MTTPDDADREALAAYVDGEMDEAALLAFEARLAQEAPLFEALQRERALRARLAAHYDPVLDEPVPGALLDLLAEAGDAPAAANDAHGPAAPVPAPVATPSAPPAVEAPAPPAFAPAPRRPFERAPSLVLVSPAPPPAPRRMPGWAAWGGMAACLWLGLALGGRLFAPAGTDATRGAADGDRAFAVDTRGTLSAAGPLREALDTQPSGPGAGPVTIALSFRDRARDFCRAFSLPASGTSGIACKQDGRWQLAQLERAPAPPPATMAPSAGYRTAGSTLSPGLLLAIDALRAGDTLDAAAEADARARGWRR